MDFDALQALLDVQTHGSLQAASKATGVSRTTLRRRLEQLEEEVGRALYRTGPEGVALTTTGRTLVEEGARLLAGRARLLERVQAAGRRDTLRVLLQLGMPPMLVAGGLGLLDRLLPDMRIVLDTDVDPSSRVVEAFDAILHWGTRPVVDQGWTRVLTRMTFGVMGSPAYLAEHGAPRTPADLAGHRLLHLEGTEPRWPCLDGSWVEVSPAHACADVYLLGMLAGQGLGLALVPVQGPLFDGGAGALPGGATGPLVHPSIEALQRVLADHIEVERAVRLDMPRPSDEDSAAATLIQVAASFGQALEAV